MTKANVEIIKKNNKASKSKPTKTYESVPTKLNLHQSNGPCIITKNHGCVHMEENITEI